MRTHLMSGVLLGLAIATLPGAAIADEPEIAGTWKLVVLAFGEDEFAIIDMKAGEAGPTAEVVAAQDFLGGPTVENTALRGDMLAIELKTGTGASTFTGSLPSKPAVGPVLGTFFFRETVYPARLEKTEVKELATVTPGTLMREVAATNRIEDPREKHRTLLELLAANPSTPTNYHIFNQILQNAEAAELEPAEVKALVDQWLLEAEPYGEAWVGESIVNALKSLNRKKAYAEISVELGQNADRMLKDSGTLEQRAAVVEQLATAAGLAGNAEVAREARERAVSLVSLLDEEYKQNVPPFETETFAARQNVEANRVVLMELFTGAQCPPCVAADVAFDALLETYEPSEMIGLQYHLHIPGPDPLTSPGALERAQYYGVNSTPSTFFDGQADARGGGGMGAAESKYQQYRKIIDPKLENQAQASIDLKASRDGETIAIDVKARTDEDQGDQSSLKLRLALVEESIRYVGSNRLRFHHHVVRALPGGAEGFAFDGPDCEQNLKVDLGTVREEIEAYLSDYQKNRPFPFPLPPIDLKGLSVVAFVQDDEDKRVLHAVMVPLGDPATASASE